MTPRRFPRLLLSLGAAFVALALAAPMASADPPKPEYADFAGCPSPEENPAVLACINSAITGGHFKMGSKNVPIVKPIQLTGGITGAEEFVFNEEGGLSGEPQPIPGGLVGITGLDWLVDLLGAEALKLYAQTELAGQPSNPIAEIFELPIKVRLVNPLLSDTCYVGSDTNPIALELTFFTTDPPPPNEPITGTFPTIGLDPERPNVFKFSDGVLVDNSFAAPAASGCALDLGVTQLNIDSLVNIQAGLPSPAGTNETVQEGDVYYVEPPSAIYP